MKQLADKVGRLGFRISAWSSLFWFYARSGRLFAFVLSLLGAALFAAAFFTGGYYYSQRDFDRLMAGFDQVSQRYNLPSDGITWAARFSAVRRHVEVADKAVEEMKQYLYQRDQEIKELEEHLYFYRTVIAPEDEKKDLAIFSVSLQSAPGERAYLLEVVLRNHHSKKGIVKGRVKVLVEGRAGSRGTMLVRDDLIEEEIKFSFRYFQRVRGTLRLPEGFGPSRLSVVADSNKFKSVKETYTWSDLRR